MSKTAEEVAWIVDLNHLTTISDHLTNSVKSWNFYLIGSQKMKKKRLKFDAHCKCEIVDKSTINPFLSLNY